MNGLFYLVSDHPGSASVTADGLDGKKLTGLRYQPY
jgi:hypothetical protein